MRQLFDVEPPGRNLSRHQRHNLAGLEISQRPHPRTLALVAMDGRRGNARRFQLLGEPVGAMLGAGKHQHLVPAPIIDQVRKQMPLVILRNAIHLLLDLIGSRVTGRYFNIDRVAQNAPRQLADIIRVSRGEHQVLTLGRQHLHNAPDVPDESHIEHPIRFVQHKALN
jgi:hypothetical protein